MEEENGQDGNRVHCPGIYQRYHTSGILAHMARMSDLTLKNRLFMMTYRYRKAAEVPVLPLAKPLSSCRVALVTTGALHRPDQAPFDEDIKGGDFSYRILPRDQDLAALSIAHKSDAFDRRGFEKDINLGFPLERFREMAEKREIGELSSQHLSFMGSITAPGRLIEKTAPEAAALLAADGVDLVFLTPL